MEFGYWEVKGQGEISRLVIAYLGLDVKEVNPKREEWFGGQKTEIGGDFPNLPYLKDGDFVITESSAIPVYLALKANKPELLGTGAKEQAQVREIEGVISDINQAVYKTIFQKTDYKNSIVKAFEEGGVLHTKIQYLSKFLGEKEFLLGHITLADFALTNSIRVSRALAASFDLESPYDKHPNLKSTEKKITELAGVKELLEKRKSIAYIPAQYTDFKFLNDAEVQSKQ